MIYILIDGLSTSDNYNALRSSQSVAIEQTNKF